MSNECGLVIGELKNMIDPMSKPIWKVARHMRIRPEAVFQIISDAFDTSIHENTIVSNADGLHFEADIASFTLVPNDDNSAPWQITYKAKEPMTCREILPHPKEAFSVPEKMINSVSFPIYQLRLLNKLITGTDTEPPMELLDQLTAAYHIAWEHGNLVHCGDAVEFNTTLIGQDGKDIYAAIEPNYYDPIPNMWNLIVVYDNNANGGHGEK